MFAYDDPSSWVLAYNLYADRLLQTNVVNQTVRSWLCVAGMLAYAHVHVAGIRTPK